MPGDFDVLSASAIAGRPVRRTRVAATVLESFLRGRLAPPHGYITESNAPADLRIVRLREEPESFQRYGEPVLELLVESETFSPVAHGSLIPEIEITFTQRRRTAADDQADREATDRLSAALRHA